MIIGHVEGTLNARSEPTANTSSTANVVRQLLKGSTFEGSDFYKDSLSRDWIKLVSVNGVSVTGMYIAAFVSQVKYEVKEEVEEPVEQDIPQKITMIEHFKNSSGVEKTRTTVWDNPQVLED